MKYLGVDFGMKKIGLAISEGQLASPYKVIFGKGMDDLIKKIERIIREEDFEKIVVGLPEGLIGQYTEKFINKLIRDDFDVISVDETLSSQKALEMMIQSGKSKKRRRQNDAVSAALILQDYLDNL